MTVPPAFSAEGAKKGNQWIPICQTGCTIGSEVRFAFHRPLLEAMLLIASTGLRWHKALTWIITGTNRTHQIRVPLYHPSSP